MFKHVPVNPDDVRALTAETDLHVRPAKPTQRRGDALTTIVEYVLLSAVGALVIAIALYVLERGMIGLVKRVGKLLAPH